MGKEKENRRHKKSKKASKYKRGLKKLTEKLASIISSSESSSSEESTGSSYNSSDAAQHTYKGTHTETPLFVDTDQDPLEENMTVDEEENLVDREKVVECLLGADPSVSKEGGPEVHSDIANRWTTFLRKGIEKEEKKELLGKYPVIKNVQALNAPKLNPELKGCLGEFYTKQDSFLVKLQEELGSAISAIGRPMDAMYSGPTAENNQHLVHLSNATRLLSDIHYGISLHRRHCSSNKIDSSIKKVVMETPIEEYLFGDNLITKVKQNQEFKKASDDLKPKRGTFVRPTTSKTPFRPNNHLNFRRQASRSRHKKEERGRAATGNRMHQLRREHKRY